MSAKPRVLIVEDEEPLTLLLRYNLEAEGYVVDSAARGDEAELMLREQIPDLVILDWMLPGLSGIELCRRLRLRPETQQLPVILLTARGEESERVRGLATGADDYVVKPFPFRNWSPVSGHCYAAPRPIVWQHRLSLAILCWTAAAIASVAAAASCISDRPSLSFSNF